ncbi:substrate-binding domain-containing protein [Myxosarcina sp. GI1]|uniref:substrate-binding domain-containing protein n=1 Tax=Myxosarcina sp. GI1 TaxID=1541065 RepID=UPI00068F7FCD|nr:substrate-binding domain-containing protein [Myxosarcina sp. GI1]
MPTYQVEPELICPNCTFHNPSSRSECEICHYSLEKRDLAKLTVRDNYDFSLNNFTGKKKKTEWGNSITGTFFLLLALAISSVGVGKIVLNNFNTSFLARQESLNKRGDIKLYETMEAVPNVPAGIFNYGGAICFAALQRDGMNAAIAHAHPQFLLRYVEPIHSNPGCTTGIQMLLDRELSVAQNSRPLTEAELAAAKRRGFELESVPVAIDGVVFYVNKSLGIKSLSLDEVRDIYTGKITNWQEVGGNNVPVVPISLDPQIDSILRLLMETKTAPALDEDVIIVRDYTSAIRKTSTTPGAISYASAAILKGQRSIEPIGLAPDKSSPAISGLLADGSVNLTAFEKNYYPLTRPLSVVFRRDGTPQERAAIAYINLLLSQEGQKIVEKAGMVSIY